MFRLLKKSLPLLRLSEITCDCSRILHNVPTISTKRINLNYVSIFEPYIRRYCTSEEGPVSEALIVELSGGDPELEHKLRVLILETEVLRQEGKAVPNNDYLKKMHWLELLNLRSKSARRKYLEFLFKIEKKKENRLQKKEDRRNERESNPRPPKDVDFEFDYSLGGNNIMLRVYDTAINHLHNSKLIRAIQFGQKLVVDCGYYNDMTERESRNCAKQLMLLFAENRYNDDPFDIHLCNVAHDSVLIKGLHKFITTMYEPWFPLNFHESSYLNAFPKENLVYLTPHCRETLTSFNHDDIYIIGAIVDKVNNEPLSLAKAKKEGIRMAKLPLDNYLQWGSGSGKSLTLNQMVSVMLDIKNTGNWNYALRHVPRRKLVENQLDYNENKFNTKIGNFKRNKEESYSRPTLWKPSYQKKFKEQEDTKKRLLKLHDVYTE